MTELANKIREAPNFPREQVPTLIARDPQCAQRIVLSALPHEGEQDPGTEEPKTVVPECLELRFYFDKEPEDHELKELALALTRHINNCKGGSLYRVSFGRLYSVVRNAARIWAARRWKSSVQADHAVPISSSLPMTDNHVSPSLAVIPSQQTHWNDDFQTTADINDGEQLQEEHLSFLYHASMFLFSIWAVVISIQFI